MIEACLFDFDGTLAELTLDFFDLRREVEEIALRHVSASFIRRPRQRLYAGNDLRNRKAPRSVRGALQKGGPFQAARGSKSKGRTDRPSTLIPGRCSVPYGTRECGSAS